ncbi:hypothetical protein DM872_19575 [Pseudomonas taiwanensis]|uniref:polysaccharide pyruvyl transferase family protein n=1 Tax=Pseudomonas taiwanensis TaxID=470150 RepID=UPI0015BC1CCE|nr:polysaccharide pyruvyl transferase family protein [Pseudomonas taiwanensis]NWL79049.1 hypothetical protein [Pseudomonas taiwanensis]
MKICIIGYYGSNFGDLLMLNALISRFEGFSIDILTYGAKEELEEQSFIQDRNITVIQASQKNLAKIVRSFRSSAAIIWGGGTCFMDEGGTGGVKYMALAKLLGCQVYYFGIGVDRYRKFKTKLCMYLASKISSRIYARDLDSQKAFHATNPKNKERIYITHDLAHAYTSTDDNLNTPLASDYLLYCPRSLDSYPNIYHETNLELTALAHKIVKHLHLQKIVILNADPAIDSGIVTECAKVFEASGIEVEIISGSSTRESIKAINYCKFLLTVRLHPAVIALERKTPFAIFNYSNKNKKLVSEHDCLDRLIENRAILDYNPIYTPVTDDVKDRKQIEVNDALKNLRAAILTYNRKHPAAPPPL